MQGFVGAMAAAAMSIVLCAASRRVDIPIITRPRLQEDVTVQVPIPSRGPLPAFQGPFVDDIESMPCFQEEREVQLGKTYTLNLCVLENVTLSLGLEKKVEEVQLNVNGDVSKPPDAIEDGDDVTEDPTTKEEKESKTSIILGVFRGWHIDPITLSYKYMIYDDGDKCMDNDSYSTKVELIPSSNPESDTKLFGLKKTGMCTFKASVLIYVPQEVRVAGRGIHTPGVIDISSAEASLPVICGKMKCRYEDITKRMRGLSDQIRDVQASIVARSSEANTLFTNMTIEVSKSTLESATQVVERSLELFHEIESLQQSLANNFLEREEAAKKEIAEQDEEEKSGTLL
ncbi:unnamed protein product [Peronospora belbahrii]|uniref:Uncharacterized protein n=1 Tax=Peronospora belbahrii TaxID=622444 RepID=A0AAU9KUW4_9STRA|nr:unnamed protein product [Peronospora belbahrii]CAH0517822.1 unnamed protein product [Peronospora belbahrii]